MIFKLDRLYLAIQEAQDLANKLQTTIKEIETLQSEIIREYENIK